ncbi:MAG: CBS domain-containing protein, partial [Burkholderiales bacterium]
TDVMRTGDNIPMVSPDAGLSQLMREMSQKGLGATAVVDTEQRVLGIFTDGDLRRLIEKGMDLRQLRAAEVMHPNPTTLSDTALAAEAADLMEQKRITSVLVVNAQQQLCGMVNSNDLMRAKVI